MERFTLRVKSGQPSLRRRRSPPNPDLPKRAPSGSYRPTPETTKPITIDGLERGSWWPRRNRNLRLIQMSDGLLVPIVGARRRMANTIPAIPSVRRL